MDGETLANASNAGPMLRHLTAVGGAKLGRVKALFLSTNVARRILPRNAIEHAIVRTEEQGWIAG